MKNLFYKTFEIVFICFVLVNVSFAQEDKSFLNPPQIIINPASKEHHSTASRKFSGIPGLAISPDGRLWTVWYSGITPEEGFNNYIVVSTRGDGGNTWKEILAIDPDGSGPVRAFDPEVWIDPDGKLWVFWAQTIGHDGTVAGVWAITAKETNAEDMEWAEPRRLTDGVMMCKPVVLSGGEWVLPASTWRQTDNSAKMVVSKDKGKTWAIRGAVDVPKEVRNFDEHIIVEKKDGTLWMLVRTKYGIGESFSMDQGKSWSLLSPSPIQHPSARFLIQRLKSGNLLLVKHGPIATKTGHSHLMAFISEDDGNTWSKGLLPDERKGVSYPDGQQTKDGHIFITYDYNRTADQLVLMTNFTEEEILDDNYDSRIIDVYNRRKIVSKGGITEISK